MISKSAAFALALGLSFAACQAPENPQPASDPQPAAEQTTSITPDSPPQPDGQSGGMPMQGRMGAMQGGMMGSAAQPGAAPEVTAAAADATDDCPATSQALVNRGRAVFSGAGNCYSCHGANAKGGPLAPDLTDAAWLNIDGSYAAIAELVRTGVAKPKKYPAPMPAKGGSSIGNADVCAAAAYVYSLTHK